MRKGLALLLVAAIAAALLVASAGAVERTFAVRLDDGRVVNVTMDAPADALPSEIELPGELVAELTALPSAGPAPPAVEADPPGERAAPSGRTGRRQRGSRGRPERRRPKPKARPKRERSPRHGSSRPRRRRPSPAQPLGGLPGPSAATVADFVIRKFRVPVFLLPIYQAAGTQYGIRWEILAAINEIETDYGRNLNVSSAGAVGWMQFMPATWKAYGVDANRDGRRDPYNPVDAIFAAANYLKASGGEAQIRRAIFAYNHAGWYVDSVLMRARLISGVPGELVGSLTGLTEGRFPVAAPSRYTSLARRGRTSIAIHSRRGAPAVAVNDGRVVRLERSRRLGRYVQLEDVYGNRFTYAGLGSVARLHPVPKRDPGPTGNEARAVSRRGPRVELRPRVFAHPARPGPREAGGLEQIFDARARRGGFAAYSHLFTAGLPLDSRNSTLRRLRRGSQVIAGTVLGRVGRPERGSAAHLDFSIRPAGDGAPRIDPKPILDGWRLLEATAVFRASGRNVLHGDGAYSLGQVLLLPKPLLQRRVLADERIEIYPCGRRDIRAGQVDRRVLATLAFLAESGLRPTVSSLRCGHGYYTKSGNVSHHSSGNAVDIAAVNGVQVLGHQDRGGVTWQAVRRLMTLQGTMRPAQIISLLDLGANTVAMGDHHDHIHVGFRPAGGGNGGGGLGGLRPGQWPDLIEQLGRLENPRVPTGAHDR